MISHLVDGEEAVQKWNDLQDSTYGSKHLASQWDKTKPTFVQVPTTIYKSKQIGKPFLSFYSLQKTSSRLEQIDVFILLDLLGSSEPWPKIQR